MKKIFLPLVVACTATVCILSCNKDAKTTSENNSISQETLSKINALGFNAGSAQKLEEGNGYLVEGDIVLTDAKLNETPTSPNLIIAQEEQYNTYNLVKISGSSRTITVSASVSFSSGFSTAIDSAIRRYNNQNLTVKFQRVSSGGNINIRIVNTGQYIASSGFPTSTGDPYNQISYAKMYMNYSLKFVTTVLTHEMGHCIGFRHTDYMNRSYSCGTGGNEGAGTVGAVHIPGTPTGPDAGSWMLACLSSTTNRPFNSNDITALKYLY